jgi:hypothetical protein
MWRNDMRYVAVVGLALFMSLVVTATGAQPATADAKSVVEVLSANTRQTTSSGATFTAPAGWSITSGPNKRVLDPPEGDSHIALVDVEAPDAGSAVASAWASYRPDARRPLKIAVPQAPNNGWEERHLYSYETSPNEKIVVYALAWREEAGAMSDYDMRTMGIESSYVFFRRLTYALFIVWVVYGVYLFFIEDWWSVHLLMVFVAFAVSFIVYRTLEIMSDARFKRF